MRHRNNQTGPEHVLNNLFSANNFVKKNSSFQRNEKTKNETDI